MVKGSVKWFKRENGYGFLFQDGGPDVFVHYTSIMDDVKELKAGEKVEFETGVNEKGTFAKNVRRVG
jgi:CspA family cold shock protein